MNQVTASAFFDELTKIAEEGSAIGRLVNADVGANEFPDADVDTPKRGDRAIGAPKITQSSPDPKDRVTAPEEQYA
jgi:hypothetical protein